MVMKVTKMYQKMKNKSLLNIEKKLIQNEKKWFIIIIRNYYFLKKMSQKVLFTRNIRMFRRIYFEAINFLQKANLNKNLL